MVDKLTLDWFATVSESSPAISLSTAFPVPASLSFAVAVVGICDLTGTVSGLCFIVTAL